MSDRITTFSPDRLHRYTLWRDWITDEDERYLQVIGLNPSTADELQDDPTVRRCIGYAKHWGFRALCMTNIFAWRDTLPANMKKAADPVGPQNDQWLIKIAKGAGMVLAAWGTHGSYWDRGFNVKRILNHNGIALHCLGTNADGSPKHPLYLKRDAKPVIL